ncbi:MAG: alpha/beta hydrolase [Bacteroidales bacterium]|nr:alpha/beta hydrolase [Bacteroidales bacterium]
MKNFKIQIRIILQIILFIILVQNTAYSQFQKVNSNNLDIYYRIYGQGTPILIIGGGPGDVSGRYISLCELLSTKYQCILVDQRGTGKSAPEVFDSTTISVSLTLEDFEAIRNELGIEQWSVLGFSYGGYLASLYANFYPSSVSSLVLLNSMGLNTNVFHYFLDNINSKLQASDLAIVEFWSDSARYSQDPKHAIVEIIRARMAGYFYDRKKSLIVSQTMKDSDFDFNVGRWIWKDVMARNLDLAEMESNFEKHVIVIQGRQDPLGESVAQSLSDYYKNSELVFIEKCGHYSWIEQPDEILIAISNFFASNFKN